MIWMLNGVLHSSGDNYIYHIIARFLRPFRDDCPPCVKIWVLSLFLQQRCQPSESYKIDKFVRQKASQDGFVRNRFGKNLPRNASLKSKFDTITIQIVRVRIPVVFEQQSRIFNFGESQSLERCSRKGGHRYTATSALMCGCGSYPSSVKSS